MPMSLLKHSSKKLNKSKTFSETLILYSKNGYFRKNMLKALTHHKYRTFAMIKPDAYGSIGKILARIESEGFRISNLRMTKFTLRDAEDFYAEHRVFFE